MASFVTTSLDIIRRRKRNRQPRLHSRWGDVAITAPIDGAWSQYNNPHLKGKKLYGPGFVPVVTGGNKEVLLLDDEFSSDEEEEDQVEEKKAAKEEEEEEEEEGDTKKRDSRARRLTRILLPSNVNTQTKTVEEKPIEFEYKPVRPNYAQELAEKRDIEARPNFRYVPASEAFFRELQESNNNNNTRGGDDVFKKHIIKRKPVPERSQSCDPCVVSDVVFVADTREAIPGTLPSNTMSRKSTTTSTRKHSSQKEFSDQTRGRMKPNQQKLDVQRSQSAAVRRQSHRRTMTLDMVGDQEDLW
jgi:hypothetical protein